MKSRYYMIKEDLVSLAMMLRRDEVLLTASRAFRCWWKALKVVAKEQWGL